MPLLADSARDITYSIEYIDRAQEFMRVKYWISGDSSFPEISKNFNLYGFEDSAIHETAQSGFNGVAKRWREILGDYGFNADSYYGQEWSGRYRVTIDDSFPDIGPIQGLREKIEYYDSVDSDTIFRTFRIVGLDSNEAELARSHIEVDAVSLRQTLIDEGRFDSIQSLFGLDSGSSVDDRLRMKFEYQDYIVSGDSVANAIQTTLGLNDSDFAVKMINIRNVLVDGRVRTDPA